MIRRNWGLLILRLGLGGVFLAFGADKLREPANWIVYLPSWMGQTIQNSGWLTVMQFLRCQGLIELALGLQLLLGCLAKWSAAGCSLMLIAIVAVIGFDQTGIRDSGLLSLALALTLLGPGDWSIDAWLNHGGK